MFGLRGSIQISSHVGVARRSAETVLKPVTFPV